MSTSLKLTNLKCFYHSSIIFCSSLSEIYKPILLCRVEAYFCWIWEPQVETQDLHQGCVIFRSTRLFYFPQYVTLVSCVLMRISTFKLEGNKEGPGKMYAFFDGYKNLATSASVLKELSPRTPHLEERKRGLLLINPLSCSTTTEQQSKTHLCSVFLLLCLISIIVRTQAVHFPHSIQRSWKIGMRDTPVSFFNPRTILSPPWLFFLTTWNLNFTS